MSCSKTQHSDDFEARNRGPSVSSQALYHWATALSKCRVALNTANHWILTVQPNHTSFCFYVQIICSWGFLIYTCEHQRFVFCSKRLQKMAYRLNETRDELHIDINIFGDKKNCSVRRYFWVPTCTTYVLVETFKVCCKDISLIVVLIDLWNSCKRLKNFSHICNHGFYILDAQKTASLRQHFWVWFFFLRFKDISFIVGLFIMMEKVCYTDFMFAFQI